MSSDTIRVRFAPSPTGHLHVGNLRTALFNWLFTRQHGGRFVLRIEDTDLERSCPEFETQIYEDMRWFGLDWDEGPDIGGQWGPYRQSERLDIYTQSANQLTEAGWAYHCFCTQEELDAERVQSKSMGDQVTYSGKCRDLTPAEVQARQKEGIPCTIRFRVRPGLASWEDLVRGRIEWQTELLGDFVIIKSDGWPVYNFAVVVDDISMEISHVIRGDGHLPNTPRQILIYEALKSPMPQFGHLSTILGPDGGKLSKRHGATSMSEFRDRGFLPEALFNFLALLGWSPEGESEILSRDELTRQFSLARVGRAPATFDVEKLKWLNREYMRRADRGRLIDLAILFLKRDGWLPERPTDVQIRQWVELIVDTTLSYLDTLSEVGRHVAMLVGYDLADPELSEDIGSVIRDPAGMGVVRTLRDELIQTSPVTPDAFHATTAVVKERTRQKGRALFHPIRVALTGRSSGPELVKLIPIYELGARLDLPRPVAGIQDRLNQFIELAESASADC